MIKVTLEMLLDCEVLKLSFDTCIEILELTSEYSDEVIVNIRKEFSKKIFHSRVNEFMKRTVVRKPWKSYRCRLITP